MSVDGHTFLLQPGAWTARGEYVDARGAATPARGETRVLHEPGRWIIRGVLRLPEQNSEFSTTYDVEPLRPGRDWTSFTCDNPGLGTLSGVLVLAGDTILSSFTAASGLYGMESMLRIDGRTYESRGALCSGIQKIGSWTMLLAAGNE